MRQGRFPRPPQDADVTPNRTSETVFSAFIQHASDEVFSNPVGPMNDKAAAVQALSRLVQTTLIKV